MIVTVPETVSPLSGLVTVTSGSMSPEIVAVAVVVPVSPPSSVTVSVTG